MKVRFNLLEEQIEELKNTSIEELDDFGNIEGQFELYINNIKFGYVHDEIPFGNELLVSWFSILNKAVGEIKRNSRYITFYVPDMIPWLEIEVQKDILKVTEIKPIAKSIGFLFTNKKRDDLFEYTDVVDTVDKKEFIECVLKRTDEFINTISEINGELMYSKTMAKLAQLYRKVSMVDRKRFIIVPKNKKAMEDYDYGIEKENQIEQLVLSEEQYMRLYSIGIFNEINMECNIIIDDYEEEVLSFDKIPLAIEIVDEFIKTNETEELIKLKEMLELGFKYKTLVGFDF